MNNETLYLKIDKNIQIKESTVHLKDIAEFSCSSKSVENKIKTLRLDTENIKGPGRYVFSVLDVIKVIRTEYPSLVVDNLGETDFILTLEKDKKYESVVSWMKTAGVCLLSFFGAAFSIMAFNNDINVTKLFGQLHKSFTGIPSDGFTLLEISYSIGVGLGILIFFHHFSKKKGKSDPTPLEVQMRTYEDEVDTTVIETESRSLG